jgi:nucleoid-associated protein YgaU
MSDIKNFTSTTIINDIDFYRELRERRGVKQIEHFTTPRLRQPSVSDRIRLRTSTHIWKYGDRFYNLAHQYYGDTRYWWVIAWYNGIPTEAEANTGDVLEIPLDLQEALLALGA